MTFGGYDSSYIKDGDTNSGYGIHWYSLTGKNWWEIQIQDVLYEGNTAFSGSAKNCIIDSGTSLIAIPTTEWTNIINAMLKKTSYMICDTTNLICGFSDSCSNHYSSLSPL